MFFQIARSARSYRIPPQPRPPCRGSSTARHCLSNRMQSRTPRGCCRIERKSAVQSGLRDDREVGKNEAHGLRCRDREQLSRSRLPACKRPQASEALIGSRLPRTENRSGDALEYVKLVLVAPTMWWQLIGDRATMQSDIPG